MSACQEGVRWEDPKLFSGTFRSQAVNGDVDEGLHSRSDVLDRVKQESSTQIEPEESDS